MKFWSSLLSLYSLGLLLLLVAVPGVASAQHALTLEQALALARRGSHDLAAAKARLEQARTSVEQATSALRPTAAAQGKYTHNYKEVALTLPPLTGAPSSPIVIQKGEQVDVQIGVNVPLIAPAAYPALGAARATLASSHADFEASESRILYTVAQAFFAAAGADELVTARRHAVGVAGETYENAQARFRNGVATRVETTRAEVALVRARQAQVEAEDMQAESYLALAALVGEHEPFHVTPDDLAPAEPAPADDLIRDARALRPEFTLYERSIAASEATVRSELFRWAPTLSGFGNLHGYNYTGFSGDSYAWAVGLQLDWILYDGGTRDGQRHLALAQKHEQEARLALLYDTVSDDVLNARRALGTKRGALEAARRSFELSAETLRLIRSQYAAGTAKQLDVLEAQDSLVSAEVAVAQARFDLALADLSLKRTAGTFPGTRSAP